ncbi:MAG TPA: hypothetical protein VJL35_00365 [Gemmatimonadaceae bacterium]|nr:hypothetical protein [Gemmatimonadaceae bacterium]
MTRFIRHAVALTLLAGQSACYAWKNVTLVENQDPKARPTVIEVTRKLGGTYDVYYPVVNGDSLNGWEDQKRTRLVRFALSDLTRARTKQISSGRTAAGVAIGIVGVFGIWWLLLLGSGGINIQY